MNHKKSKNCISIDFSTSCINFATGTFDGLTLDVSKTFTAKIDESILSNGIIKDSEKLINIIKKALSDNNVKAKDAYGYVTGSDIIKKHITIPMILNEKDVDDLVTTEISQLLPIDLSNYVIRYKIVNEIDEDGMRKFRVACAVMDQEQVESFRHVIKSAGLKPVALDVTSSTVENLVKLIILSNSTTSTSLKQEVDLSSICIAEMNATNCYINIFKGGKLDISRVVKVNVLPDEILEELSHTTSMDTLESKEIFDYINDTLSEVNMVYKYYTSRSRNNKLDEFFIYGSLAKIDGFDKHMQDILQMKVNTIDILNGIIDTENSDIDVTTYINAIGGLIRW